MFEGLTELVEQGESNNIEYGRRDRNTQIDIAKLINIAKACYSVFSKPFCDVYISPISALYTPMDKLEYFYIIFRVNEEMEDLGTLVSAFVHDEYPKCESKIKVSIVQCEDFSFKDSVLIFDPNNIEGEIPVIKRIGDIFTELEDSCGVEIRVCNDFLARHNKLFVIYAKDLSHLAEVRKKVKELSAESGIHISDITKSEEQLSYLVVSSTEDLYTLPTSKFRIVNPDGEDLDNIF